MNENQQGFGPHLMIDLSNCDSTQLDNLDICFSFLDNLPAQIDMTKITQPHVFRYSGVVPEDKGITGSIIIAESHISIHTFPIKKYAFIDIFSCRPFDLETAKAYCVDTFKSKDPEFFTIFRGAKFIK